MVDGLTAKMYGKGMNAAEGERGLFAGLQSTTILVKTDRRIFVC